MAPPRAGEILRATPARRRRTPLALTASVLLLAGEGVSRASSTASSAPMAPAVGGMVELVDGTGKLASASEMTSLLRFVGLVYVFIYVCLLGRCVHLRVYVCWVHRAFKVVRIYGVRVIGLSFAFHVKTIFFFCVLRGLLPTSRGGRRWARGKLLALLFAPPSPIYLSFI